MNEKKRKQTIFSEIIKTFGHVRVDTLILILIYRKKNKTVLKNERKRRRQVILLILRFWVIRKPLFKLRMIMSDD